MFKLGKQAPMQENVKWNYFHCVFHPWIHLLSLVSLLAHVTKSFSKLSAKSKGFTSKRIAFWDKEQNLTVMVILKFLFAKWNVFLWAHYVWWPRLSPFRNGEIIQLGLGGLLARIHCSHLSDGVQIPVIVHGFMWLFYFYWLPLGPAWSLYTPSSVWSLRFPSWAGNTGVICITSNIIAPDCGSPCL